MWLLKEVKDRVTSEYLVLALFTGKPFGFHAPADEISNAGMAVSFSNQQGFTFLDSRDGHVKLISAVAVNATTSTSKLRNTSDTKGSRPAWQPAFDP